MSVNDVLKWIDGHGWLILSGGNDSLSEIRAMALSRASSDGSVVYIGLDEDDGEDILDDMSELGAPTGYLVNSMTEDDNTIKERIADASLIVIPDEYNPRQLKSALMGAGIDAIREAYESGTTILVEGRVTTLFGKVYSPQNAEMLEGFSFVEDTLLLNGVESLAESETAVTTLASALVKVAIGIGVGSALVLGGANMVETWGKKQVSIALGGSKS